MGYPKDYKSTKFFKLYQPIIEMILSTEPGQICSLVCDDEAGAKRLRFQIYGFLKRFFKEHAYVVQRHAGMLIIINPMPLNVKGVKLNAEEGGEVQQVSLGDSGSEAPQTGGECEVHESDSCVGTGDNPVQKV